MGYHSDPETSAPDPERPMVSRAKATGWVLLALFLPLGIWLTVEVERTVGLRSDHFWTMLKADRMFGLAILDFFCTAGWAFLVLGDRAGWKGWRLWATLPVFCIVPTLGIILYLLLDRGSNRAKRAA